MNNQNIKLFKNIESNINLEEIKFEEIKKELITLFRSPNPIQIYFNSKKIKDKFSDLLSVLTLKIKNGFKLELSEEKTFVMTIYKQSNYDKVWFKLIKYYLRDSKNFDLLNYLYFVKVLNKDKQFLAKALLKLYLNEDIENIKKFLIKYNAKIDLTFIKNIYERFKINKMTFDINLREDFIECFLEKIYLNLNKSDKNLFLDIFTLKLDKELIDFSDISKVVFKIISDYVSGNKEEELCRTLNNQYFHDIKLLIDDLIGKYEIIRGDFYIQANEILSVLNNTDRNLFQIYIRTKIINLYYSDVRYIFYDYSSNNFFDKNIYSIIKGNFEKKPSISLESEYINSEYKEINDLKEIILELNDNLFSFFLLPVIYYTISEKLSLRKKDLYKIKYLLLFIFSENFSEYKKIYMFFNQLEVFLNYENKSKILEKAQVGFSIILIVILLLIVSYAYFPIGVFIGILILSLIKANEIIYPSNFYKRKWNTGIKFFAIVFLSLSSYFWFSNFDKVKGDTADITAQIKLFGTISSKEVIDNSIHYIKTSLIDLKNLK